MPSPLMRGGYFTRQKRPGTKEEVLARLKAFVETELKNPSPPEPWLDRMERKLHQRRASEIYWANYEASFMPVWLVVGPQLPNPDYIDYRARKFIGRYGSSRSD